MVIIRELLSLNKLRNFRLIAGEAGLDNMISNIVIYEYEQSKQEEKNFYKGDFVVSTLIYAKDNPELLESTMLNLLNQGIVGLAIKNVHFHTLPSSILEIADQKKIPIFLFEDIYMEDIVICVSNYIISRKNLYAYENELNDILQDNLRPEEIINVSKMINPGFQKYMASIYLRSLQKNSNEEIDSIIQNLSYSNRNKEFIKQFEFVKFQKGLFIIGNFNLSKRELTLEYIEKLFAKLLIVLDCLKEQYQIGQSDIIQHREYFDECIYQSYYASYAGSIMQQPWQYYSQSGIYQMIFPLLKHKSALRYYKDMIRRIRQYDEENNFCLYETIFAYVKHNFEVSKTAQELYQHPNTIRYRISKIRILLQCQENNQLNHLLFLMIKIQEMLGIIGK